RMKLYTTFEETVLAEEEEKIKATENDASARIDAIMKDPRVVSLMKKNPNMTFEELPEDIYGHILDISESQEAFITTIMEESDKKLSDKAKELDVYEHINNEDLGSARDDKRRPLSDLKAKVDGNGIILDGSEESILNPQEELDTSKAEIKGEDNLKENTSEVKNNEKGRSLVKPSTGNKSDIINVPEGKEKGVVLDKTPQAPEKNSFNDDETS
ncbi:MAG: hypothetical protein K2X98_00915, partial [Alphaproteobacteria bacterium]|nr:hypothetical protein [Alphaproteobacteria bacterium]